MNEGVPAADSNTSCRHRRYGEPWRHLFSEESKLHMCGFVGIIALSGANTDPSVIQQMSAVLRHRGPDDEGIYISGPVGFGFRRLSILDLSPAGHQPMFSRDGQTVLVFNGEIYNYLELRQELENLGHTFDSSG